MMRVKMRWIAVTLVIVVAVSILLLSAYQVGHHENVLRVTTTTSLYNTGLLDKLAEAFKQKNPEVSIHFIAVGSGEALRRAAQGDADIVISHAPNLEKQYLDDRTLKLGGILAYNYFIVVGPSDDPAGIAGMDPVSAMARLYETGESGKVMFVSRADKSGTHVRELMLWSLAGITPSGRAWYLELGVDMAQALMVANEKRAYILSDVGTYLKFKNRLGELRPLIEKGDVLINIYSVYVVNKTKVPGVNEKLAEAFVNFILSEEGQKIIGDYGITEYGEPLFFAAKNEPNERLKSAWERVAEFRMN
ncbi:MAG: substrate-binding domain-containing protein [Nitrososphaerota archaeon]|nr:substrate-binding domain-containing protein [Aigarchaeota archaeon]MDW8076999.1 substrate-binding domain-containing protein [Nitrososphaerota archaeon]